MKSVLVTGAAGNIGSSLVNALLEKNDYHVVALDDLSTGARAKLPVTHDRFRFVKADVNDLKDLSAVFASHDFRYVFHFAAVVGVRRTLENPLAVLRDVRGIENVLSLAKNSGVSRVFYSSSSEVYGEPVFVPQNEETTPLNARLPYSVVKNIGEVFCRSYLQEFGLPYTVFRFFNTYGPNQSEDFVIPRFMKAALVGDPITVYGDGNQTRTFCHVDDNVETMMRCLEYGTYVNDTINIGSDEEISIIELAVRIVELVGSRSRIVHLPPLSEGDMTRRRPDISKMRRLLQRELIPLTQGLATLVHHLAPERRLVTTMPEKITGA